ncbi:hypothetical protein D3C86_1396970 [compost metagenome]
MSFMDDMAALADSLVGIEVDLGVREHAVSLRSYTRTGANPDAGTLGTLTPTDTPINPRPKVEIKTIRRYVDGEVRTVGDAVVSGISRIAHTYEQLTVAEAWVIAGPGGGDFTLIDGGIKVEALGFAAVLKRKEG